MTRAVWNRSPRPGGTIADPGRAVVVIGAGPAGLAAADLLSAEGVAVTVVEQDPHHVGGLARTVERNGYRFDIGGHRFFTKNREVDAYWRELLGDRFESRERRSRIYFRRQYFSYPLEPLEVLSKLGPVEAVACMGSFARARLRAKRDVRSFEDWVVQAFGRRLFDMFFRTYTEKVWGLRCDEISADWAAQRIRGLSMTELVRRAVRRAPRTNDTSVRSLIERFEYPRLGPGELWESAAARITERGGRVRLDSRVVAIHLDGRGHVRSVEVEGAAGRTEIPAGAVVSTMPIRELVAALDPAAPSAVREAAAAFRYRDFVTVAVVIERADLFDDQWIYVHDPNVLVGRIQNFKNWSPAMVPDASRTVLGLEYFCFEGDALWNREDRALGELATTELVSLGLVRPEEVVETMVVRQPKAYPVYDQDYQVRIGVVRRHLEQNVSGLELAGRNGLHRYNNQDHAVMTGWLAARNLLGERHDVWSVNADAEYLEEDVGGGDGERLVAEGGR
jgi:protoporphyrinogen oxidase